MPDRIYKYIDTYTTDNMACLPSLPFVITSSTVEVNIQTMMRKRSREVVTVTDEVHRRTIQALLLYNAKRKKNHGFGISFERKHES
jgi:hypothetical protein